MELRATATAFALAVVGMLATAGCSPTDSGYKAGQLGNGGFYFSCDDAVSCAPYTDDAKKFPKTVALGSTFDVRFTPSADNSNTHIVLTGGSDQGVTINPVGPFVTRGPSGLTAVMGGIATIASRDASGQIIDFVTISVSKPDALVVYSTDATVDSSGMPTKLTSVALNANGRMDVRAFAERNKGVLAGTLAIDWRSSDATIFDIESTTGGLATIVGRKAGSATLIAVGGTFEQHVPVVVSR